MQHNRLVHLRRFLFGLLLAASLTPTTLPYASVAHADGSGSLTISPGTGVVGSKFHLQGTGFQNFSLVTHDLDVTVFDASNTIVDQGSVTAGDDGSIDVDIDTVCDLCPIKTVPLADSVTFTIH